MNKTLVFKNTKGYDLFLITPNGAGRRLPNGKCVSGSFYIQTARAGHLTPVPEHMVVEEDILWSAEVSGYQYPKVVEKPVEPVVEAPVLVPEVAVAPVVEAPPAPVVEEVVSVADRDLMRLGMEEIKLIAATKGIDFPVDIKKKKLIALINSAR